MTKAKRDKAGKWKPGESGNPGGRPPGRGKNAALRRAIDEHLPEIVEALAQAAKQGDTAAAGLLLGRTLPALRPERETVTLEPGATLADTARAVLASIAAGEVAPDAGAEVLQGVAAAIRVIEVDELLARVEALEAKK